MKWIDITIEARSSGGYIKVLGLIIIGLIFMIRTPTLEYLEIHPGQLSNFKNGRYLTIFLEGKKIEFNIYLERDKKKLTKVLPTAKYIEIWIDSKESHPKQLKTSGYTVKQLKVDGRIIIEYNWWEHVKVPVLFVLIGLILIPFVERKRRKIRRSN